MNGDEHHAIGGYGSALAVYGMEYHRGRLRETGEVSVTPGDGPEWYECACGEEFESQSAAVEHLEDVRGEHE